MASSIEILDTAAWGFAGNEGGNGSGRIAGQILDASELTARSATCIDPDFPVEVFSDVLICEPIEEPTSQGGIILPGAEKKQREGLILAAGPGRVYENGTFVPNPVKAGDVVVFGKYASGGEPIVFRQKQYLLLRAGDCVGKLKAGAQRDQIASP